MVKIQANTEFECGFVRERVPIYSERNQHRKLVPRVCLRSAMQTTGGKCRDSRCSFNGGRQRYLSTKGVILPGWKI